MPNPHKAGPGDGCIVHAGILTPHGGDKSKAELTSGFPEAAKERFIEDVIKELSGGSPPFPCGDPLPPISPEMVERLRRDLPNIEIFPDFHKNILDYYRDLARSMDNPSEYSMAPIGDPVAMATTLGGNLQLKGLGDFVKFMIPNPPLLAVSLGIELPDLPSALLKLPIPKLPPAIDIPLPELPQLGIGLPSLEIPCLLNMKLSMVLGFPDFMTGLIGKLPNIAIKLLTLDIPGALGEVCKLINDAGLFGKPEPQDKNGVSPDTVMLASRRVLARKMAEMSICHALSKTLGTAPSGITGLSMKENGYSPPLGEKGDGEDPEKKARDKIQQFCMAHENVFWGGGEDQQRRYAYAVLPMETAKLGESVGIGMSAEASSCGMFARTALSKGGAVFYYASSVSTTKLPSYYASDDPNVVVAGEPGPYPTRDKFGNSVITYEWFSDFYRGNAVADLIAIARLRKAFMEPTIYKGLFADGITNKMDRLPSLKRGDVIIVSQPKGGREHVIMVKNDYNEGDEWLDTIEGGAADKNNHGKAGYFNKEINIDTGKGGTSFLGIFTIPNPSQITVNIEPGTGYRCTGIRGKTYRLLKSGFVTTAYDEPYRYMGVDSSGLFAMGDGRVVSYLIDSWKLISGNPNPNLPQPGSDPLNSKEMGDPGIEVAGAPIGDTNDEALEDQTQPLPPLTLVPRPPSFVKQIA